MRIATLDPACRADLDGVVDLHYRHLDTSLVVGFGRRFVRDFYYDTLVREGLMEVVLCRAEDRVVGFISHTSRRNFMSIGLRRHFLRLSWLLLRSLIERPALLGDVLTVVRLMRARAGKPETDEVRGEVLSLVAEEAFQKKVPEGGRSRLTVRLFEEMTRYFQRAAIDRVYLYVLPENRASNLFCSVMGCSFEKLEHAGRPVHRFTYTVPPAAAAGAEP